MANWGLRLNVPLFHKEGDPTNEFIAVIGCGSLLDADSGNQEARIGIGLILCGPNWDDINDFKWDQIKSLHLEQ